MILDLTPAVLTAAAFSPFGEVIELEHAQQIQINEGLTTRYNDLLTVDIIEGRVAVNLFRTQSLSFPHKVEKMERHPLTSQAFIPMNDNPFLVLVGLGEQTLSAADLKLFITNGQQGINLKRNTWHHYQMVIDVPQDFIVIDRIGKGHNLQEADISEQVWVSLNHSTQDDQ